MKRVRLTAREIEAVLGVAGNAEPWETFAGEGEEYARKMTAAYESGTDKLRTMLSRLEARGGSDA